MVKLSLHASHKLSNWLGIIVFCCSALLITPAHGSTKTAQFYQPLPGYEVSVKPTQVVLGEPLRFLVTGKNLDQVFSQFDLQKLSRDFVIDDMTQHSASVRFKLYPLRSGKFVIEGQKAGFLKIPDFNIEVLSNPDVSVSWQSPKNRGYSQQILNWKAEVEVSNPAFKVTFQPQEYYRNNQAELRLHEQSLNLAEIQESSLLHRVLPATHKMMAAVNLPDALKAQNATVHSPVVEVKNTSNKRWKFFDYPQAIHIQPLPTFLPLSAAVGQIEWQYEPLPSFFQRGKLYYWRWNLSAYNLTQDYLKGAVYPLLNELQQSDNIEFLTETIQASEQFDEHGLLSQVSVNVPYRIKNSGWVRLVALQMNTFNPQSGRVESIKVAQQLGFAMPSWLVWLLQWLFLTVLFGLVFFSLVFAQQRWHNWQFKNKLKSLIASPPEDLALELWLTMKSWQHDHRDWRICLACINNKRLSFDTWKVIYKTQEKQESDCSLLQWYEWYQTFYGGSMQVERLIALLNDEFYAKSSPKGTKQVLGALNDWLNEF